MLNPSPTNDPLRLASAAPVHPQEFDRLVSVCGLAICDRGFDPILDGIARLATETCGASLGVVTLIRESDQIYLGRDGVDGHGTDRDEAICAHTILSDSPFVVEDLLTDPRFAELPIATQAPYVRFYAGAPIRDRGGLPLGSVCVLDTKPQSLDSRRLLKLERLATITGVVLETRRFAVDLLGRSPKDGAVDEVLADLDRVLEPLLDMPKGL